MDQNNSLLVTDTVVLSTKGHVAFITTSKYPVLAGKIGIARLHASLQDVPMLGLLVNQKSGTITFVQPTGI